MDTQFTIVLIIVFLGLSAFFSASETAFFALQRVRVQHLVDQGVPQARRIQRLKEHPERFLATILLGSNLVNTAMAALATTLAIKALGDENQGAGAAIATAVTTAVTVVVGDAVPKAVAARIPERIAFLFLRPIEVTEVVLLPLASVLHAISALVTRPLRTGAVPLVSQEELRMLVAMGVREGTVQEAQAEIVRKAFLLGGLRAQEVMTPRTEIVWIEKEATLAEFLKFYAKESHNRFPVYEGEQDNVVGILDVRDVMKAVAEGALKDADPIAPLLRPAHFYPESRPVHDILVEMRAQGAQMAMLIDEFGGVAGLLTFKHIAGEIVGRITEEEGAESQVKAIDERTVQVDASMRISEANERLRLALPEGDYETLAGFLLERMGRIPRVGEQLQYDGLRLVVSEMKGVKIERVLVTKG
jgi:putative hemolysin